MSKTIAELNAEKDELLFELDTFVQTDNVESDKAKEILKQISCIDDEIKQLTTKFQNTNAITKCFEAKRFKIKIALLAIPSLLLTLFIVLTIVLNTATVFNGTYKGENQLDPKYKYEIAFNNKIVTYTITKDDVKVNSLGSYVKNGDNVELQLTSPDNRVVKLKRKSVYVLTQTVRNADGYGNFSAEMELKCNGAIWLQVFYSVGTVASAVFLIVQILRRKKVK